MPSKTFLFRAIRWWSLVSVDTVYCDNPSSNPANNYTGSVSEEAVQLSSPFSLVSPVFASWLGIGS